MKHDTAVIDKPVVDCLLCGAGVEVDEPESVALCRRCEKKIEKTENLTPDQRLKAVRLIVQRSQFMVLEGTLIDMQTANVILKVYDWMSEAGKEKMMTYRMGRIAACSWKVME